MKISGRTAFTIAASIERNLLAQALVQDEALPAVRALSASLGVSPATVASAYKLLQNRGLLVGYGRRGTRVAPRPAAIVAIPPRPVPPGLRDLATGNPDPALLPPLEPALRGLQVRPTLYGEDQGRDGLAAFAAAEFEADGVRADTVVVLNGALDAIERVLREHLRTGDRVVVEDPSFPGIFDLAAAAGYTPVPLALDEDGPRPDALATTLRRGCRALVVTPRAQNPTGGAVRERRAADLRRVLHAHPDVLLIENDYAGPIAGAPFHSIRPASHAQWVTIRSVSKFLGPDLRLAVATGDALTMARVRARQALGERWVSHVLQQLTLALWSDPSSGRRLARAEEVYVQRRTAAVEALRARGITAHGRSGFNVWVPVRDEGSVVRTLAERGWVVAPGARFRVQSPPGIRVTVSTLSPEDAVRFAADLAAANVPSAGA